MLRDLLLCEILKKQIKYAGKKYKRSSLGGTITEAGQHIFL